MQKTKTIPIRDKSFTLKELPVRVIWDLVNNEQMETEKASGSMLEKYQGLFSLACPDLTKEALIDLYPSEIKELWDGFEEVNSDFLAVARKIGLGEALIGAVRGAVMSSIKLSAFSLLRGMGQRSGNMGTGFFSKLLKR